jgi:LytS/YehU family sensor histidine kinase
MQLAHALDASRPGTSRLVRRVSFALIILGAWTAYGLVNGTLWGATSDERGLGFKWTYPSALVLAWTWAFLTPVIFIVTRRMRPGRVGWVLSVGTHTLLALACAALATFVRGQAISYFSGFQPDPYGVAVLYWLDVWFFVYLTLVVIGRALDLQRRYASRVVRDEVLSTQLSRAQLQYLESQLQPHFLFNALNTIQELAHEAPQAAERMLRKLRALLGMSLARHGQDEVTLADELAGLEPYLDIQRVRFAAWLHVDVHVPDALRPAVVPRLVLQPLVENAIKHGLAVRQAPGRLSISAERVGERLRLVVRDDGVGLRTTTATKARDGIGLSNVVERLRQLYGNDQRFEMQSPAAGGTEVLLEVPFRTTIPPADPVPSMEDQADSVGLLTTGEFGTDAAGPAAGRAGGASEATTAEPATDQVSPALSGRAWLGIAGLWCVLAVFWTNQMVLFTERWRAGRGAPAVSDESSMQMIWSLARLQIATSVIWLALSLPVLWGARRFRLTKHTWTWRLPAHVLAAHLCGFIHMEAMFRFGLSSRPALSYSNLNPLTGDFFIYFGLLAWSHSRDFVAWFRARDLQAARLTAQVAKSRFHALRVQLRPEFLDATLGRLIDIVHVDVPRAERLIARLADTLRLTLELGRNPTVTLAQELDLVQASLEAHRLGIRPGVVWQRSVDPRLLSLEVPSRLLCTLVDELLANSPGDPSTPLSIRLDVQSVSGSVQVTIRADPGAPGASGTRASHHWWHPTGVAARAVRTGDSDVSVVIPDASSVILMIGGTEPRADARAPRHVAVALP